MSKYNFFTRLCPLLLLLLPILVLGTSYCVDYKNFIQFLIIVIILIGLGFLLSTIDKNFGKKKEKELWKEWGSSPIALLLNYNNFLIDEETKDRYHSKLLKLLPTSKKIDFKTAYLSELNLIYNWWGMYLIKHIPDNQDNSLLNKKNIRYGFRRHIWGLKKLSIKMISFSLIGNFLFHQKDNTFNFLKLSLDFYISESILLVILIIWVVFVNTDWVKTSAFDYSKRLLKNIDGL